MRSPLARLAGDRLLRAVAAATLVVSILAVAFPGIDLAVSALFHRPPTPPLLTQFPAESLRALSELRLSGMALTRWIIIALLLAGLAKLLLPLLARAIPTRPLLFLATSLTIGPGLIVNSLFKTWWGRPRPNEIVQFGGTDTFFPAWIPGGACPENCSFPSGEASSAMWLIAFVFVVPPAWRRATLIAALIWAVIISANRIAFGGHFLSDVLIGWGMTSIVVLICRDLILDAMADARLATLERAFARAGRRILARLGCRDLAPHPDEG
jgi:membrane-associated PAP2 superfamily phosphatase